MLPKNERKSYVCDFSLGDFNGENPLSKTALQVLTSTVFFAEPKADGILINQYMVVINYEHKE